jgi:predicted RecA/RadA family phage recombinase
MRRFVNEGNALDLTAPSDGVVSDGVYKIGAIICIASATVAAGLLFAAWTEGVYDVTSNTGAAWAEGDTVYWDDTAKVFTKTSTSNTKAGVAVAAKDSAATTGRIKLIPSI